jgi:hypothetical protein
MKLPALPNFLHINLLVALLPTGISDTINRKINHECLHRF